MLCYISLSDCLAISRSCDSLSARLSAWDGRDKLGDVRLKLCRPMVWRVLFKEAVSCRFTYLSASIVRRRTDEIQDIACRCSQENLFARFKEILYACPVIADHCGSTGGGFEKAYAGRKACFHHRFPGEIQGESLLVVKSSVADERKM